MKTSSDYKKAFEIVSAEISAWDPYALLANGAPNDEFHAEVSKILARLPAITDADELGVVVADVFRGSFDDDSFSTATCREVASRIIQALASSGVRMSPGPSSGEG